MAQVKIMFVRVTHETEHVSLKEEQKQCEQELTNLVNQGWRIVAGGGNESAGFVILQKD